MLGVYKPKDMRRYRARVMFDGQHFHLGYFDTPEQASHVRGLVTAALDGGGAGVRAFLSASVQ